MKIIFIHPTLGLGGAERWLVDMAVACQSLGHEVQIFCNAYDQRAAFADIHEHGLSVQVIGSWLPASLFGRLKLPCALLRMTWLGLRLRLARTSADLLVVDLVSHLLPWLRTGHFGRTLFYCHYPDLLMNMPGGSLYQWYRRPWNRLEVGGLAAADEVMVNSRFTGRVFGDTFPELEADGPRIVYPGIDTAPFTNISPLMKDLRQLERIEILVLGRFHPSKQLELAVTALAALSERLPEDLFRRVHLCMAGGFDERDVQQTNLVDGLRASLNQHPLGDRVSLRFNITDQDKVGLYAASACLLFTPAGEHLGLVPLEAMAAARPVVAVNNGGPCETLVDGQTGFLIEPRADAFADSLARLIETPGLARDMGLKGRERVKSRFDRLVSARDLLLNSNLE